MHSAPTPTWSCRRRRFRSSDATYGTYFSERLVALALFDPDPSLGYKRDMIQAIDLQKEEEEDPPRKSAMDIKSAVLAR